MHPPITQATFSHLVSQWETCFQAREVGCLVAISKAMMLYRLEQYKALGNRFSVIDFDSQPIEDGEDLSSLLKKTDRKYPLFILGSDHLLEHNNHELLSVLDRYSHEHAFIWVITINPLTDKWNYLWGQFPSLIQNIIYQPLFKEPDVYQFIDYLCDKWSIKVSKSIKTEIVAQCGGVLWLVKQGVRIIRNQGQLPPNWMQTPEMELRIKSLWSHFTESEQKALRSGCQSSESMYLSKMGWVPLPKIFWQWLERQSDHSDINLSMIMSSVFSKQEQKIVTLLINHPHQLIDRDAIAQALWSDQWEQYYSDWTIDQLISRIRKRLILLNLSPHILHTIKGKGYVWNG